MKDPLRKAAAEAPPRLGEGCLSRYDLSDADETLGTEFAEAAGLWRELQDEASASPDASDPHRADRASR